MWAQVSCGATRRFPDSPHLSLRQHELSSPRPWMASGQGFGPIVGSPQAAWAAPSEQYVFRMMGAHYQMERPLIEGVYRVWAPQERLVEARYQHDCHLAASPAENADGSWAQRVTSLNSTLPAAREATAREVMEFLMTDGLVGFPPIITTDAQLGCSVMAYRGAEILFGSYAGDGSILVRLEGSRARTHSCAKCVWPQRAEVGNCPCC